MKVTGNTVLKGLWLYFIVVILNFVSEIQFKNINYTAE